MNRRLIYVVGPSGAGKDSVLSWLREHTPASAPVYWARRTINRSASNDPRDEAHESVASPDFERLVGDAAFAMQWEANTHQYGIRQSELRYLNDPMFSVMVNGSRAHLPIAAHDYPGLTVLHITADAAVLRERLQRRGRESAEAIEARLKRNIDFSVPNGCTLIEINNTTTLEMAGQQLMDQLRAHALWPTDNNSIT